MDNTYLPSACLCNVVWSCTFGEENLKLNYIVVGGHKTKKDEKGNEVKYLWIRNSWCTFCSDETEYFKLHFDK